MHNGRIDADDQIEVMDQRRRVGKVMQILGEIVQYRAADGLPQPPAFLQRDELHPRYFAKQCQPVESERAATIAVNLPQVELPTSPAQSDPQAGKTGKPRAPMGNIRRVCREIRRRSRNALQRGADGARQAQQPAPKINRRRPAALSNDLTYTRQQSCQRRVNREDGPPGARGNLRNITTELQRLPVALIGE